MRDAIEKKKFDEFKDGFKAQLQQIKKAKEDLKVIQHCLNPQKQEETDKKEYREFLNEAIAAVDPLAHKKEIQAKEAERAIIVEAQVIENEKARKERKKWEKDGATGLSVGRDLTFCSHGKHYFCNECNRSFPKNLLTKG